MEKKKSGAKAQIDFRSWAEEERPQTGPACGVCSRKEVREAVHTCLSVWAEGRGTPSYSALYRILQDQFSFSKSYRSLRDHIQYHETPLWTSIRELRQ